MNLVSKYNVPAPRYTSYPTVPYWEAAPTQEEWERLVSDSFRKSNSASGISLYIHLPFCESLCTYCACNTRITVNHAVEEPYIEAVLKEWGLYLKLFNEVPKIAELHLGGGTPTFFSPANLQKLLEGILSTALLSDTADLSFEGHPNNTSTEHLQTLFDLGFRRVSFGIQDLDEKVQVAINRVQPLENVEEVVSEARRIGYTSVNFDLVYGLPFQTKDTITRTLETVTRLRPERIAFYSYAHVPWLKPAQRKFSEADLPGGTEKRELYECGLKLFREAGYEDIGMDHFALRQDPLYQSQFTGSLHRNFMGYTAHYTELMIGLGASAISDSWTGFSQNIKPVELYEETVISGKFPIHKGHVLTEEDQLIRRLILDAMCRYQVDWSNAARQLPEFHKCIERCLEPQEDGLLTFVPEGIEITEKGRAFLRNICLCFDLRYWRKIPQAQSFSSVA